MLNYSHGYNPVIHPEKDRSNSIVTWLLMHPLIDSKSLCKSVGCDTRHLDNETIPAEYLEAFERVLKEYGYQTGRINKDWSKKDIQYVIENYGKKSYVEIANHVKKGVGAVERKIYNLKKAGIIKHVAPKIEIDKYVPQEVEKVKRNQKSKDDIEAYRLALDTLEKGDSFVFPKKDTEKLLTAKKTFTHKGFVTKKENDINRRVWRLI